MVDASKYHERTKHTPEQLRSADFSLDFENRPRSFKLYRNLPREPLESIRPPQAPALSVLAESSADPLAGTAQGTPGDLDRETLATLCYLAGGVTGATETDRGTARFRAASCTGNLHHVDLYLVAGDRPGLDAGVYHFDPDGFALDRLRAGDYRGVLAAATGGHAGVADAPVTVVATSTWWRNAWKYRDRAYRHAFWDSGTVLANLLAGGHALDRRAEVVAGFADNSVVDLLGLDPEEEAPLELVALGSDAPTGGSLVGDPATVEVIDPETEPYSPETVEYPLVWEAWQESTLPDGDAAARWRRGVPETVGKRPPGDGERVVLDPVDHETASARPLYGVVMRRRSSREFADAAPSRRKLGTVLDRATRGVPGDWNGGSAPGLQFNDVYVLATDVEGVPDGTYQFHPGEAALERIGDADDDVQTRLALGQSWAGDAHVNVYCMADVDAVVDRLGDRGYRLAQLEAGVVLGRLYLATYAHRDLGGTGLTFFDDEVTAHLSPRAERRTPMTLFAMGVAAT
ncbi:MAG: SagB/ThcOx family dehydrogenase [Halobacteriales archaeon]